MTAADTDREVCAALAADLNREDPLLRDRIWELESEVERLRLELRFAEQRAFDMQAGHWVVQRRPGYRSTTWIGEINSLEHARVRVALQMAADDAALAVMALRAPNQDCNVPILDHRRHAAPCATNPSAVDVVMTVLDVVAAKLAAGEGSV